MMARIAMATARTLGDSGSRAAPARGASPYALARANAGRETAPRQTARAFMLGLDDATLAIDKGMFGLLGPNGAGKTTLMRILYGLYRADSGVIRIEGEPVEIHSPKDAIARGITSPFPTPVVGGTGRGSNGRCSGERAGAGRSSGASGVLAVRREP